MLDTIQSISTVEFNYNSKKKKIKETETLLHRNNWGVNQSPTL